MKSSVSITPVTLTLGGALVLAACGGSASGSGTAAAEDDAAAAATTQAISASIAGPAAAIKVTPSSPVRALVELAIHDSSGLAAAIASIYDPTSSSFRAYLTQAQLLAQYAPSASDVSAARAWLQASGLTVARVSTDNLFIEVDGPVSAFQAAFKADIVAASTPGTVAYAWSGAPTAAASLSSIITDVLLPDVPATAGGPPVDTGTVSAELPSNPSKSMLVSQIAGAYGAQSLYSQNASGRGVTIGIAGAGAVRASDRQSFWQAQNISRADVTVQQVADAPSSFNEEATLDLEWSGGVAPGANVVFYQAPDNHDGSLLFAVNEAVGNDAADVVSDSFSHHESTLSAGVMAAYDTIGQFAAAMGVTLVAASGDTNSVDAPSASPWFTAVGGTTLTLADDGSVESETVWKYSGCGRSAFEVAPAWQSPAVFEPEGRRAVADVALQANSYFLEWDSKWTHAGGTSFATPTTAALLALVDSARFAAGKPRAGYLNTILYSTASVQAAYADITAGHSGDHYGRTGWDYPTGWGSTNAAALAAALP